MLIGCGPDGVISRDGKILDVPYEISIFAKSGSSRARSLASDAIDVMEKRFKALQPDRGEIGRLNEDRSISDLSSEVAAALAFADSMRIATRGTYDYRQGALKKLWRLVDRKPTPPAPVELASALAKSLELSLTVEGNRATLSGEGTIDLGDVAAGFAVDGAAQVLIDGGISCAQVKLGNVTRIWGAKDNDTVKWRMEFPPPPPEDSIWYVLTPPDGALCSYSKAIDGFEYLDRQYPRLIDPRDGLPSDSAITVASWAPDGASAGALGQALFVMGRRLAFEWLLPDERYGIFIIHHLPKENITVAETSIQMVGCLTDSLPTER